MELPSRKAIVTFDADRFATALGAYAEAVASGDTDVDTWQAEQKIYTGGPGTEIYVGVWHTE